mmetsp:Transcript_159521/g.387267  ORF Transcript_159521/g.387267 Transcript_159521/m.387267 type:complete len:260 (+) Transcript_159521:438-1217(+)
MAARSLDQQRRHARVGGKGLGVDAGACEHLEDAGGVHQVRVHAPEYIADQGGLHERHAVAPDHVCRDELVNLLGLSLAMQEDDDRLSHAPRGLGHAAVQHEAEEHIRNSQRAELGGHGQRQVCKEGDRVAAELFGGSRALYYPQADRLHEGDEQLMPRRAGGRDVRAEPHGRLKQGQVVPVESLEDLLLEARGNAVEDLQDGASAHVRAEGEVHQQVARRQRQLHPAGLNELHSRVSKAQAYGTLDKDAPGLCAQLLRP